jgi:hypothetical protein
MEDAMRVVTSSTILVAALIAAANGSALQFDPPEPGVYAQTEVGLVPMKKPIGGVEIAGSMRSSIGTRAFVFPVDDLTEVPVAQQLSGFIVNLATVQDAAAASAQLRFVVGEHVREPDFQVMTVRAGKFRTGVYQFTSANLTHEWLAAAYAKLTSTRKWKDKHPRAIVGLVLNGQTMYPIQVDTAALVEKR